MKTHKIEQKNNNWLTNVAEQAQRAPFVEVFISLKAKANIGDKVLFFLENTFSKNKWERHTSYELEGSITKITEPDSIELMGFAVKITKTNKAIEYIDKN